MKPKTVDLARGKWRGILIALGVDKRHLTGKHAPCPMCEGTDRFRFDNKNGDGTFICNQCGAGKGFDLLMQVRGWDFPTAAAEVDKIVGNVRQETAPKRLDDETARRLKNDLWLSASPIHPGDLAHRYLVGRGHYSECNDLRLSDAAPVPHSRNTCPALLALVRGIDGSPVNIHRTFLGPNGKADLDNPRAMMPGCIPDGAAVRLYSAGEVLGIAEGIETAFAAADRFQVPVWSAINSTMLAKWTPPEGVREVIVFGDCDAKFGGQAAAFALAHKLSRKLKVRVEIPDAIGTDWADAA